MNLNLLSVSSVMKSIGGVVLAIVILLVMVTIHEFGHYVAGKILGFKINEFSVGFGPALFKKRNKKTGELFALRVIPLGGYCAFDGEDEEGETEKEKEKKSGGNAGSAEAVFSGFSEAEQAEEPQNGHTREATTKKEEYPEPKGKMFNDQPPWKRIIVLVAGATMNYLLALFLIIVMFLGYGRPHSYIMAVEKAEEQTAAVVTTEAEEAAEAAVKIDDVILTVNGRDLYLTTDYMSALKGKKAGDVVSVEVYRRNGDGKREKLSLNVALKADANFANLSDMSAVYAAFGLDAESCQIVSVIMKDGGNPFAYSAKLGGIVLRSLGELLTGKLGLRSMGGPVTTIKMTAEAASYGGFSFLNIASMIGVNLAVFNLLPIPALDGCKVIFCIIEWIRKKPVNRKVEAMIHFIGIIALFGFAILVDLLQFFW